MATEHRVVFPQKALQKLIADAVPRLIIYGFLEVSVQTSNSVTLRRVASYKKCNELQFEGAFPPLGFHLVYEGISKPSRACEIYETFLKDIVQNLKNGKMAFALFHLKRFLFMGLSVLVIFSQKPFTIKTFQSSFHANTFELLGSQNVMSKIDHVYAVSFFVPTNASLSYIPLSLWNLLSILWAIGKTSLSNISFHLQYVSSTSRNRHTPGTLIDFREIRKEEPSFPHSKQVEGESVVQNIQEQVAQNREVVIGAFQGAKMIGSVTAYPKLNSRCWIYNLYVSNGFRGKKIGRELLRNVTQKVRELGAKKAFLSVNQKNFAALHLYKQMGYTSDAYCKELEKIFNNYMPLPKALQIFLFQKVLSKNLSDKQKLSSAKAILDL